MYIHDAMPVLNQSIDLSIFLPPLRCPGILYFPSSLGGQLANPPLELGDLA